VLSNLSQCIDFRAGACAGGTMGKVFISYRRKDAHFVHRLAEKLQENIEGVVFYDKKIAADDFAEALLQEVHECNVFVLAITENTFAQERIHKEDDWVRREIALALQLNKPIALAVHEGQTVLAPNTLPLDIQKITSKQALWMYVAQFDESVINFAQHCVNIAHGGLALKGSKTVTAETSSNRTQAFADHGSVSVAGVTGNVHINHTDTRRQEALSKIKLLQREKEDQEKLFAEDWNKVRFFLS
jgi:hypothetical protein